MVGITQESDHYINWPDGISYALKMLVQQDAMHVLLPFITYL